MPCWLAAELVGLGGLLHGLGIHRLVDHAGNGAIAAQGQPTDAILGGTPRPLVLVRSFLYCLFCFLCFGGFNFFHFPCFDLFLDGRFHGSHLVAVREPLDILARFPLDDGQPGIEKHVEFLYPHTKHAGKEVVAKLMDHHQDAQSQNQFKRFNQCCTHLLNFSVVCFLSCKYDG